MSFRSTLRLNVLLIVHLYDLGPVVQVMFFLYQYFKLCPPTPAPPPSTHLDSSLCSQSSLLHLRLQWWISWLLIPTFVFFISILCLPARSEPLNCCLWNLFSPNPPCLINILDPLPALPHTPSLVHATDLGCLLWHLLPCIMNPSFYADGTISKIYLEFLTFSSCLWHPLWPKQPSSFSGPWELLLVWCSFFLICSSFTQLSKWICKNINPMLFSFKLPSSFSLELGKIADP